MQILPSLAVFVGGEIVDMISNTGAVAKLVLLAEQQPSADAANNLWWLTPNPFGPVPIRAKRIMKVDGFYVVFQVKDLHFSPTESPYLDSMTVQFSFTNSDPRNARR